MESFGFDKDLRSSTSSQASPQMQFDHWEIMKGNPFDENNKLSDTIKNVRKRKGQDVKHPPLDKYNDKLWFSSSINKIYLFN